MVRSFLKSQQPMQMEHSSAAHSLSTTSAHQLPPCPTSLYRSCYFSSCQQTLPTKTPRQCPAGRALFTCAAFSSCSAAGATRAAFIFGIHPLPAGAARHLELCRVKDSHLSPTHVLAGDREGLSAACLRKREQDPRL